MSESVIAKNVKIRGKLVSLFRNCPTPDGWFSGIFVTKNGDRFKATGTAAFPASPGMVFKMTGDMVDNDYGEQLKAYPGKMEIAVDSYESVLGYFASPGFRRIDRIDAMQIAREYGSHAVEEINSHPADVQLKLGFTNEQMDEIRVCVANTFGREAFMAAFSHLSVGMVNKALKCKSLGETASDKIFNIRKNPYILIDVDGIGFKSADKVALNDCGIGWDDKTRLMYVMTETMNEFMKHNSGASYCDMTSAEDWNDLYQTYLRCCGGNATMQFMQSEIARLCKAHVLIPEQDGTHTYLYTKQMHAAQSMIVTACKNFILRLDKDGYGDRLEKYEKAAVSTVHLLEKGFDKKFDSEQIKAVKTCLGNPLSCISGRPGTGKSSVIRMIGRAWMYLHAKEHESCEVLVMAPTGKAVNRLSSEIHEFPVATIARVMVSTMHGREKNEDKDDCIFVNGACFPVTTRTLIMIDESSMIDTIEAAQIFDMFGQGQIVFVGDKNQLPPIEPGPFFQELTGCGEVPVTELSINHRTESGSQVISDNAQKILQADMGFTYDSHFSAIPCGDETAAIQASHLYQSLCASGVEKKDILMLCPVRKSAAGVTAMNTYLQNTVNRYHSGRGAVRDNLRGINYSDNIGFPVPIPKYMASRNPDLSFRIGDRVMNTKNHADMEYKLYPETRDQHDKIISINIDKKPVGSGFGVYNGDFGTIVRYYYSVGDALPYAMIVMDDWRVIEVPIDQMKEFCLGYCVTIHKAQGSEAQHVIILFPDMLADNPFFADMFLSQNMLYTAVTRARRSVTLIGNMGGVKGCVMRELKPYHTQLRAWLFAALMPLNVKRKMQSQLPTPKS